MSRLVTDEKGEPDMKRKGWIGVDLDGTLAVYYDWETIGDPIPLMVERVQQWLKEGKHVKIFTARVSHGDRREKARMTKAIEEWCKVHIGKRLPVTCTKDSYMELLFDDRAITVEKNTGRIRSCDVPQCKYQRIQST